MGAWSVLSLLPDADVIGFSFGVRYGDPWGHRGATHSLIVAVAVGLAVGLAARRFGRPVRRTALFAIAVLASHGLLDTLTDGGLGCALFWPFDLTRYFAPWRPIPVAPIGLAFFSPYGLIVSATELVLFAPLVFYALRPATLGGRRIAGVVAMLWLPGVWLIASSDPVRERVVGVALREDTAYATGYSEAVFRSIASGQSQQNVGSRLGPPYGESWFYPRSAERAADAAAAAVDWCAAVRFERGSVVAAFDPEACRRIGITAGTAAGAVSQRLGAPAESCWQYSWSPRATHYRARDVCFVGSTVDTVIRGWR
jgi:inner membrane protein